MSTDAERFTCPHCGQLHYLGMTCSAGSGMVQLSTTPPPQTDADRLRKAIEPKRYAHEVDHLSPQEICAAIVEEFGVAGTMASTVGWTSTTGVKRSEVLVRAILDVAEGKE